MPKECKYCEGLGYRIVSVENDQGSGDIVQEECERCHGNMPKDYQEVERYKANEKWAEITWYVLSNVQTGRMSLADAQETLDLYRKDEIKVFAQQQVQEAVERAERFQSRAYKSQIPVDDQDRVLMEKAIQERDVAFLLSMWRNTITDAYNRGIDDTIDTLKSITI